MKKEKSCGCIVFNKDMEVLLIKMNAGHWSFPKGHVEENESEFQTALRETVEETNIRCDIYEGFREVTTYSPKEGVLKDVVFFVGQAKNDKINIQKEELQQALFVDITKAKESITFESDLKIFEKAIKFIRNL